MTKQELVEAVAKATNITKEEALAAVESVVNALTRALEGGERIELRGFGSFSVKKTKGRTARNPRTGMAVEIPAGQTVRFRPGKELKARLGTGGS